MEPIYMEGEFEPMTPDITPRAVEITPHDIITTVIDIEADYLTKLAAEAHDVAVAHGFIVDPEKDFGDICALLHSEVSESYEAWRKRGFESWKEEGGKPEGVASEFADLFIRLLHYCHVLNINLETEYRLKMAYNRTRSHRHGDKKS
jgi:NTP pyrophosphatase (non-canonical NTP hydrolase)